MAQKHSYMICSLSLGNMRFNQSHTITNHTQKRVVTAPNNRITAVKMNVLVD